MTPKLDERLSAIVNEINDESIADIGTDHGKVVVSAIMKGKAQKAIAVDISAGSLMKAKESAYFYGVDDRVEFICADGISRLPYMPSLIIIAGMGGNEIVKILGDERLDARLLLVPHQDANVVRRYLAEKQYGIAKDFVVKSGGKYYEFIVTGAGDRYAEDEYFVGKNRPESGYYWERLEERKKILETINEKIKNNKSTNIHDIMKMELKEIDRCLSQR